MISKLVKKFKYAMTRIPQQRNDVIISYDVKQKYIEKFNVKDKVDIKESEYKLIKALTLSKCVYTYKNKEYWKYWDMVLCLKKSIHGRYRLYNVFRDEKNRMYPPIRVMDVQKKKYDDIYKK